MRYSKLAELGNINSVGRMTKGLAEWIATVRDLNVQQITKILENKTVADINFFNGRTLAGIDNANFFDGSVDSTYTNMPDFVRPTNEFFLIMGMRLKSGLNANVNATVWTNGIATAEMNGTFTFFVNGVKYRAAYPLFASVPAAEDIDQGVIQFDSPIIIGDQEPFNIRVQLENNGAATFNLLIELIGIGTIS